MEWHYVGAFEMRACCTWLWGTRNVRESGAKYVASAYM